MIPTLSINPKVFTSIRMKIHNFGFIFRIVTKIVLLVIMTCIITFPLGMSKRDGKTTDDYTTNGILYGYIFGVCGVFIMINLYVLIQRSKTNDISTSHLHQ